LRASAQSRAGECGIHSAAARQPEQPLRGAVSKSGRHALTSSSTTTVTPLRCTSVALPKEQQAIVGVVCHDRLVSEERIDEDALRAHGDELMSSWCEQGDTFTAGRPDRGWKRHQLAAIFALTAHVHRLFPVASRLLDEGCVLEAIPLIRTAYECALTAHWLAQVDDGAEAFMNRDVRSRAAAERTAQKAVSEVLRNGGPIAGADLDKLETSAMGPAESFEQLCDDLTPGGADAYFHYRAMSMYQHPSVLLVDQYLSLSDDGTDFAAFHREPRAQESGAWRGLLTSSLIWSGRALDFFDGAHTRRSVLRRVAKELGTPDVLRLSAKAQGRQQNARRAARTGPRGKTTTDPR
jgi:hypothetical protein